MTGTPGGPDVTQLLDKWKAGDREALADLIPLVYGELHQLADAYLSRERGDHTLQPTALVHEAYMRLVSTRAPDFRNRTHFYGAAARVMRRILVDHARKHGAGKRGSGWSKVALEDIPTIGVETGGSLLELDEAMQKLAAAEPSAAEVVELRCFGGLSIEEVADFLAIAPATVSRRWTFARAFLYRALST